MLIQRQQHGQRLRAPHLHTQAVMSSSDFVTRLHCIGALGDSPLQAAQQPVSVLPSASSIICTCVCTSAIISVSTACCLQHVLWIQECVLQDLQYFRAGTQGV